MDALIATLILVGSCLAIWGVGETIEEITGLPIPVGPLNPEEKPTR